MMVTSEITALIAMNTDDQDRQPDSMKLAAFGVARRAGAAIHRAADDQEHQHRHGERADRAERLAQEDLDLEPGQLEQSAHVHGRLVADRVTGELEEHVLERRLLGAEAADPHLVFGQALNHLGDETVAPAVDRELARVTR